MAARLARLLRRAVLELLLVETINYAVFKTRFWYFTKLRRNIRVYQDDRAVIAPDYSLRMLKAGRTSSRPLRLIRPLSVIDGVVRQAKVLSIGCRFETELLYLVGHGFDRRRIRGLDMISYSPWVDVGNMHDMPYEADSWDVVILGWVLAYSDDPTRAASEVLRVCKDGGIVAVAVSYYPEEDLRARAASASLIGSAETRIQTVSGILRLFGNHVDRVFFQHDATDPAQEATCAVIFGIRKDGAVGSVA